MIIERKRARERERDRQGEGREEGRKKKMLRKELKLTEPRFLSTHCIPLTSTVQAVRMDINLCDINYYHL